MGRQSENSFDKHFREKLSNFEKQPSELSWIAVSANLDAIRAQRRKRNFWIAGILAIVLLAGGGFFAWYQVDNTDSTPLAELQAFPEFNFELQKTSTTSDFGKNISQGSNQLTAQATTNSVVGAVSEENTKATVSENMIGSRENSSSAQNFEHVAFLDNLESAGFDWDASGKPDLDGHPYLLENGALDQESFRMARVGLITGMQNGTLTGSTINNYIADENASRTFQLRPVFGIAAAYDFSNSFGLETNILISSAEGQEFNSGDQELNLSLNYIRIPVMAKYRMIKMVGQQQSPIAFNAKAGVQYGRLNWINIDDFNNRFDPNEFNSNELGLVAELAIDKYMSDDYILTLGTRGTMNGSLENMGNFFSPNSMTTYTLGIYLQLNYGIK